MSAVVAGPGGGAVLDGVLERVTFANPETGYTIARIAPERGVGDLITAVGPLLGAQIGEFIGASRVPAIRLKAFTFTS